MTLDGGDVEVQSGTGFRSGSPSPFVRLTVTSNTDGHPVSIWVTPTRARRIGLDLISAASVSILDTAIRVEAKRTGLDGDSLIDTARELTDKMLAGEDG